MKRRQLLKHLAPSDPAVALAKHIHAADNLLNSNMNLWLQGHLTPIGFLFLPIKHQNGSKMQSLVYRRVEGRNVSQNLAIGTPGKRIWKEANRINTTLKNMGILQNLDSKMLSMSHAGSYLY